MTGNIHLATVEYDFDVLGGSPGDILGELIPQGALVTSAYLLVPVTLASAGGQITTRLFVGNQAITASINSGAMLDALTKYSGPFVEVTTSAQLKITKSGAGSWTAGKYRFVVEYIL